MYLPEMITYMDIFYDEKDLKFLKDNNIPLEDVIFFVSKVQHLVLKEDVIVKHVFRDIRQLMITLKLYSKFHNRSIIFGTSNQINL